MWNGAGQEAGGEEVKRGIRVAVLLGASGLGFAGCATVDPGVAFIDVSNKVRERSGQNAKFIRSPAEALEIETLVREILKEELTAERAARIALVNNRELQAHLQDLGVAQADLAQADRLANPGLSIFDRFAHQEPKGQNYEISLVQDLLDILVRPLRKKFAAAQLEATKLQVGHALIRTMSDTKIAFFTLAAQEQLATRLALILDIEQTGAAFARRQSVAGNINNLELLNHEAAATEAEIALAMTRVETRRGRSD